MKYTKTVVTAGLAMFSMFFGSGNLVFPVLIGTATSAQWGFTAFGLILTGVVVPFLGLLSVILFAGDRTKFFSCIGKWPAFAITFLMLSVMGPIGVIPRCMLVTYGGIQLFMPSCPFWIFSALFAGFTALLIWKHDKIIPILGRVLTPWLMAGVLAVVIAGLWVMKPIQPTDISAIKALTIGLLEGYQVMDLLAAFFFAATAVGYVSVHLKSTDDPRLLVKLSTFSAIIASVLLGLVYVAFVLLGAKYAPELTGVPSQQLLAAIAGHTMGKAAIPVMSFTIALACLTTATALTMLFADFFTYDILRGRISRHMGIIITLALSLIVSFLGFDKIRGMLGAILTIAYPALIALAVGNIVKKLFHLKGNWGGWLFWLVFVISGISFIN